MSFQPLHPTLKACKCGYIGSRSQLYKHFDAMLDAWPKDKGQSFFEVHGESILNVDDPRIAHAQEFINRCANLQ